MPTLAKIKDLVFWRGPKPALLQPHPGLSAGFPSPMELVPFSRRGNMLAQDIFAHHRNEIHNVHGPGIKCMGRMIQADRSVLCRHR